MNRPPSFPPPAATGNADSTAGRVGERAADQPMVPGAASLGASAGAPSRRNAIPIGNPLMNRDNTTASAAHPSQALMNPTDSNYPPNPAADKNTSDAEFALPPAFPPRNPLETPSAPTHAPGAIPTALPPSFPAESLEFPPDEPPIPKNQPHPVAKTRVCHPWRRFFLVFLAVMLVAALAVVFWGLFLVQRVESQIGRVDALSGAATTPGTTWLIAGSDSREGLINDGTEGERSDSILLVHQAPGGQAAMVSLPRDTYTEIPGKGAAKLNAAFSWGGAPLLVQSVEGLTGLTVNHYVQVGMSGVSRIVDAVGGVNVCWDQSFHDRFTALDWQAGCHDVDGRTALLFSRMRYSDPTGDIGRTKRQRLVISAVLKKAVSREVLVSPSRQLALADAGATALSIDRETKTWDVARLVLAMRRASGDGMQGVPPIASVGYNPGHGVGSTVLLDREKAPVFFEKLTAGTLSPADFQPSATRGTSRTSTQS